MRVQVLQKKPNRTIERKEVLNLPKKQQINVNMQHDNSVITEYELISPADKSKDNNNTNVPTSNTPHNLDEVTIASPSVLK